MVSKGASSNYQYEQRTQAKSPGFTDNPIHAHQQRATTTIAIFQVAEICTLSWAGLSNLSPLGKRTRRVALSSRLPAGGLCKST